jgi:hypothetical protein
LSSEISVNTVSLSRRAMHANTFHVVDLEGHDRRDQHSPIDGRAVFDSASRTRRMRMATPERRKATLEQQ